jgi:hypothetical protein
MSITKCGPTPAADAVKILSQPERIFIHIFNSIVTVFFVNPYGKKSADTLIIIPAILFYYITKKSVLRKTEGSPIPDKK